MRIHALKMWPSEFQALSDTHKKCEVRLNDRDFAVGDYLICYSWEPAGLVKVSGEFVVRQVTHVLHGFGLTPGYVALSLTELVLAEQQRVVKSILALEKAAFIQEPQLRDAIIKLISSSDT